jgi:hypothetical protein
LVHDVIAAISTSPLPMATYSGGGLATRSRRRVVVDHLDDVAWLGLVGQRRRFVADRSGGGLSGRVE